MPALPSSVIDPLWDQFQALLPSHPETHPLGCHRPRIADRLIFDKLVQVLVFGCAYGRIADATCSATTLRRRRDAWIAAGVMATLATIALAAYDRLIGLDLTELAVDGCVTEAPCGGEDAGRSPVDRGKQGRKRSTLVEGHGLPLGSVIAPAARHDSPLLEPTLAHLAPYAPFPAPPTVHLDRGYDFPGTPARLAAYGLVGEISPRGKPAPVAATGRWKIERTHAWLNAFKKLVWCTERRVRVIAFWLTFAAVVVIVRRLVREGWTRYRGTTVPPASPEEPAYWRRLLFRLEGEETAGWARQGAHAPTHANASGVEMCARDGEAPEWRSATRADTSAYSRAWPTAVSDGGRSAPTETSVRAPVNTRSAALQGRR